MDKFDFSDSILAAQSVMLEEERQVVKGLSNSARDDALDPKATVQREWATALRRTYHFTYSRFERSFRSVPGTFIGRSWPSQPSWQEGFGRRYCYSCNLSRQNARGHVNSDSYTTI